MALLKRLAATTKYHSRVLHRTFHANFDSSPANSLIIPTIPKVLTHETGSFVQSAKNRFHSPAPVGFASFSTAPEPSPQPRSPYSRNHHEKKTVPFSPSELYQVVANVDEYHQFVPWCTNSRVIQRLDNNLVIADLSVGFRFLNEKYTSVITLDPDRSVSADVPHSGLFDYLITDWTFQPGPSGSTNLTFYVEFAFRNPVYQRVTNLFFEEVVRRMVSAFERQCVRKYRAPEHTEARGFFPRW